MTTTLKTNTNRHGQNRTLQDHDNMQAAYYSHLQPVPVGYNAMQGSLVSSLTTKNGYAAMGGQSKFNTTVNLIDIWQKINSLVTG